MVLLVHLVDDSRGAAEGLVSEEYRGHGLNSSETMVVDDLADIGALHALYGLALLVVVHKDDTLSLCA